MAYEPIRTVNYAASIVNVANPGTYNCVTTSAPSHALGTGWSYNAASSQYLDTGYLPKNGDTLSIIIRFKNVSAGDVHGEQYNRIFRFNCLYNPVTQSAMYHSVGSAQIVPYIVSGIYGASQSAHRYVSGVYTKDVNGCFAAMNIDEPAGSTLHIGCLMQFLGRTRFLTGEVAAYVCYPTFVSDALMAATMARMALL